MIYLLVFWLKRKKVLLMEQIIHYLLNIVVLNTFFVIIIGINKMKKLDGCKTYSVILNERELEICKRQMLKIDIRNIDVVSNTSKMLRYLVRLGINAPDLFLDQNIKDELRCE